jgi:hypothetical protein
MRRMREAALAQATAGYTRDQVTKAIQLITDNGLVTAGRPGVYQATSSNGEHTYVCTAQICTCKGCSNYGRCYHMLAVAIMAAVVGPPQASRRVFAMAA